MQSLPPCSRQIKGFLDLLHVTSDLKWSQHVDAITSKAATRLHFLKQLKRSGAGQDDLLCFYGTVIQPVLEYACPVLHSSLTAVQTKALESLQRRVLHIIYEDSDYAMSVIWARFDTLESRHEQLTERFFKHSVLPETSCLHYLLPDKHDVSVTGRLCHARTLEPLQESLANAKVNARQHCVSLSCLCNSLTQIEWVVQLLLPPKSAKSREIQRKFKITAVPGHPRSPISM